MSEPRLLTDAELAAIRERAPHTIATTFATVTEVGRFRVAQWSGVNSDALALLAHIDALTARLETAERVVEAARDVMPHNHGTWEWDTLRGALRTYDVAKE